MLLPGLQRHQVDHVDHAHTQIGRELAQQATAARVSSVGTSPQQAMTTSGSLAWSTPASPPFCQSLLAHSQMPMPGAVLDRRVHRQPLRRRLLAGDDDVDVVAAAQAVVGHRQQVLASGGR
jgi:hypothetical protein